MCAKESQQARYTWWFGLLDGCCSDPPRGRPQIIGFGGARRQAEMTDQGTADSQRRADGMVRNARPTIALPHFHQCTSTSSSLLTAGDCLSALG